MRHTFFTLAWSLFISSIVGEDADQRIQADPSTESLSRVERIMQLPAEDAALKPELIEFLKIKESIQWDDNAHVYAWGAGHQTDEPYRLGLQLSKQLRQAHLNFDHQSPLDTSFLDRQTPLRKLPRERLCALVEPDCFPQWLKALDDPTDLLSEYRVHQQRYVQFLQFTHFADVVNYTFDDASPFQPLRFLSDGIIINHLDLLLQLKAGRTEHVLEQLENEALGIRRRLVQADTLIAKMMFHFLYDHHIGLIHAAHSQGWLTSQQINRLTSLRPLSRQELSTRLAWETEQRAALQMIQKVFIRENAPITLTDLFYPGLVDRMIKPNELLNELYVNITLPVLTLADMDATSFYQAQKAFDLKIDYDPEVYPMKAMFNASTAELKSRYLPFTERMFALDMKMQLLRARIKEGSFTKVLEQANAGYPPYLHRFDQSPPFIEDDRICYKGINESRDRDWCLPLIERFEAP